MINTITINSATCSAVLSPLWQYDYGQYLKIEGIDLPQSFEVDFATIDQSSSVTMLGEDGQVQVPDDMLDAGVDITAYIYLHSDDTDGYTEYVIQIPVIGRPSRTEETPTPQEQTLIEQAITVLNHAVEQTASDVEAAQQAAEDAETAAQTATESAQTATDAATSASASATAAATSASAAATSAGQAAVSATSAATYANAAAISAQTAQEAVASIGDSVTRAEPAASTAISAAQTATTKAAEATTSAGTAAQNATTALNAATNASASATQAATSATSAQTAQTAAETAQTAAESAAAQAEAQADRAEGYANRLTDFLPTDTASGSIASFPDGADNVEIKSAVVQIVPKQASGTPTPESPLPITGWDAVTVKGCGVNLLHINTWENGAKVQTKNGVTMTINEDGSVTATGTATAQADFYFSSRSSQINLVYLPAGTYTFLTVGLANGVKFILSGSGGNGFPYKELTESSNSTTGTITNGDVPFNYLVFRVPSGATVSNTYNVQLQLGSTASSYEEYTAKTYPLTLPSTVYGGTLTYEGDGVWTVTVDRGYKQLDGTETLSSFYQRRNGETYFMISGVEGVKYSSSGSATCTIQSDVYGLNSISPDAAYMSTTFYGFYIGSNSDRIRACIKNVANSEQASAWITANTPTLVYELATPTTYTLTTEQVVNTLKGQNNFWADCGDSSVTYRADIQLYMQKLIAAALNS